VTDGRYRIKPQYQKASAPPFPESRWGRHNGWQIYNSREHSVERQSALECIADAPTVPDGREPQRPN